MVNGLFRFLLGLSPTCGQQVTILPFGEREIFSSRRLPSPDPMKRLFAALLSAVLLFGFAPAAHADVAGLTPCADSSRFQERAAAAATEQAKARFAMYSKASCGEDGLPHLIVDGRFSHAGDFLIPSLLFLYITGWIGWAGRSYMMAVRGKGSQMKEIQIDTALALKCSLAAAKWPLDALAEMRSGAMFADNNHITVSPR